MVLLTAVYVVADGVIDTEEGNLVLEPSTGRTYVNNPSGTAELNVNGMSSAFNSQISYRIAGGGVQAQTFLRGSDGDFAVWMNGGAGEVLTIQDDGNVGVGITNPSKKLDVDGAVNARQLCINGDCKSVWDLGSSGGTSQTSKDIYIYDNGGNPNILIGDDGENLVQLRFDSNGNYGFLQNWKANKVGELALNPYGGNVGIGTTSPTAKLDVSGTIRVSGTATFDKNPLRCTTRTNEVNSFVWSSGVMAKCNDDEVMTGGGCYINDRSGGSWVNNAPDGNGYYCLPAQSKEGGLVRAFARCCKFK